MLYNILRNRLKPRHNNNFVKWRAGRKVNKKYELHHWLESSMGGKKLNDYLLAEISEYLHKLLHYSKDKAKLKEDNEIDFLIDSLENIFDYIEFLEQQLNEVKND